MAHIQYTSDGDEKHGKRKGQVYQSGLQLRFVRKRVSPLNPRSTAQQFERGILAYVSARWRFLTNGQKLTWYNCTQGGLTGYYLWMHVNILALRAGGTGQLTSPCASQTVTDIQVFSTVGTATWTKPAGATLVEVIAIGGGGGGGGGCKVVSGTAASGGNGGGGGGYSRAIFSASTVGASVTVNVGAGGTGGAAQSTNSTNGNGGGSSTSASAFGDYVNAGCGNGGDGGLINADTGTNFGGVGQFLGQAPLANMKGSPGSLPLERYPVGGGAGGGGGGVNAAPSAFTGSAGGVTQWFNSATVAPGAAGAINSNGGTPAVSYVGIPALGAGGGGASVTGSSGRGGDGRQPGGAGGGGGSRLNGTGNAGRGGNGGAGAVIVITYF